MTDADDRNIFRPWTNRKPFKVLEDDHHDQMSVHVFRDYDHFVEWMKDSDDKFDPDEFEVNRSWEDGNLTTWSSYDGIYEVDHTKD